MTAVAALIPFWAVKGTEPSGHAVMWVLYGAAITSALIWLIAMGLRRFSNRLPESKVEKRPQDPPKKVAIQMDNASDVQIRGSQFVGYETAISGTNVEGLDADDNLYEA